MRPGIDYCPCFKDEINAILNQELLIGSNAGTFGAEECCRKVGTGESKYGERREYETVGGNRRVEGCDRERMPGRMLPKIDNITKLKILRSEAKKRIKYLKEEQKKYAAMWEKNRPKGYDY